MTCISSADSSRRPPDVASAPGVDPVVVQAESAAPAARAAIVTSLFTDGFARYCAAEVLIGPMVTDGPPAGALAGFLTSSMACCSV